MKANEFLLSILLEQFDLETEKPHIIDFLADVEIEYLIDVYGNRMLVDNFIDNYDEYQYLELHHINFNKYDIDESFNEDGDDEYKK